MTRARILHRLGEVCAASTVVVIAASVAEMACAPLDHSLTPIGGAAPLSLTPCHLDRLSEEVRCAIHEVFEDRRAQAGRRLPVHLAVLPALRRSPMADPLFLLAGGPGQGARELGVVAARFFRDVRRTRDIVLVDFRGTGASRALSCPKREDELADMFGDAALDECLAALDANPRHYTHTEALADLDEIRQRLGYQRINLWGGSWGTRAALLYALMYPEAVRSVVLDGAVALDMEFPVTVAHDAQRALDRLIDACAGEPVCASTFPAIGTMLDQLLAQFDRGPIELEVRHPRTGAEVKTRVSRSDLVEIIRVALYTPSDTARLLQVLKHAAGGDFSPLLAQVVRSASILSDSMAIGFTMSILCSEDWPEVAGRDFAGATAGTLFGSGYADGWRSRCQSWPKGAAIAFDRAAVSSAPALVLSGDRDPVTPPERGEQMARHFSHARHIVVPAAAHNASFTGCLPDLIAQFIDTADGNGLDARCATAAVFPEPITTDAGAAAELGREARQ